MNQYYKKVVKAAEYINSIINEKPDVAMVLGSGLGVLTEELSNPIEIDYEDIPYFPKSTVKGHEGKLVFGTLENKKVLVMKGRFHYFEGYELNSVTFGIRVFKQLGIDNLFVTNAAGGVNEEFSQGALMIISDHIGLFAPSALRGENIEEFGPRFPDMCYAYSRELRTLALDCAKRLDIEVKEGVYAFYKGPNYETPAEIRAYRALGADAVGMSTVPEVVVASHMKMNVIGISCITNMAAGIIDKPLNHNEVMETANKVMGRFKKLVREIVSKM